MQCFIPPRLKAIHIQDNQNFKPKLDERDNVVANTGFIDSIPIKIGARIMLIHNVDTLDGMTNGQLGSIVDVVRTTKGMVDKLVMKPQDSTIGKRNQSKFPMLSSKYPGCIFIERASCTYSLRKKSNDDGGATAIVKQFPIKLAFCITAHKIQGQSILSPTKVAMDIDSCFGEAQAYVMLSRVQSLHQVYILNKLTPQKIRVSSAGLTELQRLDTISINRNPTPWMRKPDAAINILSLNCAGLKPHFDDIRVDEKVLCGDILHFSETSLTNNDTAANYDLPGYTTLFNSVGNGKGLATYHKVSPKHHELVKEGNFQITKLEMNEVIIFSFAISVIYNNS